MKSEGQRHTWARLSDYVNGHDTSSKHHRQNSNIPLRLNTLVREAGIAIGCCFAPRRHESSVSDFLVITQMQRGEWINDGPDNYEEVYQEDLKCHSSAIEDEAKQRLENEMGLWAPLYGLLTPLSVGIKTSGFKSYFT